MYYKQALKILKKARNAHKKRTNHTAIFVYGNFVECETCNRHAHIAVDRETGKPLYAHNKNYTYAEFINPQEF